jgi:trimeric autotransporter adhesin
VADIGVIAQEVEQIFPSLVHTNSTTGIKSVEYGNLVAPIIEAIKELASTIKTHTTEIDQLRSENRELKKRLDAIEARLSH